MDVSSVANTLLKSQPGLGAGGDSSGNSFAERLQNLVADTNRLQNVAEQKSADMAAGKADGVETVIALSKADLALRYLANLRNRALEAYNEILRLQV